MSSNYDQIIGYFEESGDKKSARHFKRLRDFPEADQIGVWIVFMISFVTACGAAWAICQLARV